MLVHQKLPLKIKKEVKWKLPILQIRLENTEYQNSVILLIQNKYIKYKSISPNSFAQPDNLPQLLYTENKQWETAGMQLWCNALHLFLMNRCHLLNFFYFTS